MTYTEMLIGKGVTFGTVNNHLSGVKTFLTWHGITSVTWDSPQLKWNRRSAKMVLRSPVKEQSAMTFRDFLTCLFLCEGHEDTPIRLGLLLCFLSNVTIQSVSAVDITRNMLFEDVEDQGDALKLTLKWTKSSQFSSEVVYLPKARTKILCPVRTWRYYKTFYLPGNINPKQPILNIFNGKVLKLVTSDQLRLLFNNLFVKAEMSNKRYTPHSLRRGGATFLADSELPIHSIKMHGLWKTDSIELYLKKMSTRNSPVFKFLQVL